MSLAAAAPGRLRERAAHSASSTRSTSRSRVMLPPVDTPPAATTVLDLQHEVLPGVLLARRARLPAARLRLDGPQEPDRDHDLASTRGEALVERLGLDPDRVRAIHLAVDHERFTPDGRPREPFLLYPANAWPHKNHARLFEAFARGARASGRSCGSSSPAPGTTRLTLPDGVESRGHVAARRARRALPHAPPRSSSRASTRASGCPASRRWRAAARSRPRTRRRCPRSAATPPSTSTRLDPESIADGDPRACSTTRPSARARAGARGSPGTRAPAATTRSTSELSRSTWLLTREPLESASTSSADELLEVDRRLPSRAARAPSRGRRRGRAARRRRGRSDSSMWTYSRQSSPTWSNAQLDELLHAVQLAGRDHVVVRLVLLEHQPHRAHVVAGVAPVAPRVEVAEPELACEPERDRRRRVRDLARDEVERPPRRLVVVEDPASTRSRP